MPTLHWINKDKAVKEAKKVPYRILKENKELSYGIGGTENVIIKGDNLEVLKSLLPYYRGQIKCIYIDPPYNTGNIFEHYNDNLEHSIWLNMMYPRLQLMRELLAEDGSIWVSIDDDEQAYLKTIMDEIFGRENFVTNIIWQKKYSPANDTKWISDNHDFIVVYAKKKEIWRPNPLKRTEEMNNRYKNIDNDPRGPWKPGCFSVKTYSKDYDYPITTPSGNIVYPPAGSCWQTSKERYEEKLKDNRIYFGKNMDSKPQLKQFLSEVQQGMVAKSIWLYNEVGHNQIAKKEAQALNSKDVFATPKPESLMKQILELSSSPRDLILDCFLGSGTTAAVAHKMGRRYIGVEMGEHAITHVVPRLKKVIDGTDQGGISKSVDWKGGGAFRFYELGETIFDETGKIRQSIDFNTLASHIWFSETGAPLNDSNFNKNIGVDGKTALLGINKSNNKSTAYILLYNGILKDKRPEEGNVLTHKILDYINNDLLEKDFDGNIVIYGDSCRLRKDMLEKNNIVFKQIPYEIKGK